MYINAKYLLWNDLKAGTMSNRTADAIRFVNERYNSQQMLMYHFFEEHATGPRGKNLFLMFEGREWTYAQFYADLQRVGNWLMNDLGVKQNEIVALDGGNSPEFLMLWFALDGIGACPAFINCNLTSKPLVHCVQLSDCRILIAEAERKHLVGPVESDLDAANIKVVYYDPASIASLFDTTPIPQTRRMGIKPSDLRGLLYTSGTTGFPKGVIVPTGRSLVLARSIATYLKLKPGDRIYTALPLYHASANALCTLPTIYAGSAIVVSRKFSHKTFWPEVRASKANIVQHVGELCRYLVNAPPDLLDKVHNVKMAWGNGMRAGE
jgi:acyl-CoA synthetase (AMP-forming)/AMP-acid ligase II